MSKKSKQRREHKKTRGQQPRVYDQRRSDAITVAWVISALACGIAGFIGGLGIYFTRNTTASSQPSFWETLTPLMLFIAAVTGLIVGCLTPLVYVVRRTPPPLAITMVALFIALFPIVALIVLASMRA